MNLSIENMTLATSSDYVVSVGILNKDSKSLVLSSVLSSFGIADSNFNEISSSLEDIDKKLSFLMANQDVNNHIIVGIDETWYYDGHGISSYNTLSEALASVIGFSGTISFVDDMNAGSIIASTNQDIVVDLNGHSISCDQSMFAAVGYSGKMKICNGNLYVPMHTGEEEGYAEYKFIIQRGEISLDDVNIYADANLNISQWNYRVFNMSQSANEILDVGHAGASVLKIGSNAKIDLYNAHHGESLIICFSPKMTAISIPTLSGDQFDQAFPDPSILMPRITVDGFVKMSAAEGETSKQNMPGFIAGNGTDKLQTVIDINRGSEIRADGHALYFGNAAYVNVNGGTIVGDTGICMRSGFLSIPRNANPTIIGLGAYKAYDPLHTIKESGDWGRNLYLGHAVLLENNGSTSYGAMPVSADIKSGTFISYNNTAIGSYGAGTTSSSDPTLVTIGNNANTKYRVKFSYTNNKGSSFTKQIYFFERPTFFADGIQAMRRESQEVYVYETGSNPDYHTALSSDTPTLNASKFESTKKVSLTDIDSLYKSIKDIYMLLGVDPSNISSIVPDDNPSNTQMMDSDPDEPIESPATEFGREVVDPEPNYEMLI